MKMQETRQCPECGEHIDGIIANESNKYLRYFECNPCDEQWYEDIKYCVPEVIPVL